MSVLEVLHAEIKDELENLLKKMPAVYKALEKDINEAFK